MCFTLVLFQKNGVVPDEAPAAQPHGHPHRRTEEEARPRRGRSGRTNIEESQINAIKAVEKSWIYYNI